MHGESWSGSYFPFHDASDKAVRACDVGVTQGTGARLISWEAGVKVVRVMSRLLRYTGRVKHGDTGEHGSTQWRAGYREWASSPLRAPITDGTSASKASITSSAT